MGMGTDNVQPLHPWSEDKLVPISSGTGTTVDQHTLFCC